LNGDPFGNLTEPRAFVPAMAFAGYVGAQAKFERTFDFAPINSCDAATRDHLKVESSRID
jgi:hypothetical protein